MPLTAKGKKIMKTMKKHYGAEKGKKIFYAMVAEGKLTKVEGKKRARK